VHRRQVGERFRATAARRELTENGGDPSVQAAVRAATKELGMPATAVADAIAYAVAQPDTIDVNEIIMRSTAQG
jgi:NADP-dependent 3-hydroxy acid dehydrogenase YdfG